jgi:hypothetical protein
MGQAKYVFSLSTMPRIIPNEMLSETKIPDSTPGVIVRYALNDEQGLPDEITLQSAHRYFPRCELLFIAKPSSNDGPGNGANRNG